MANEKHNSALHRSTHDLTTLRDTSDTPAFLREQPSGTSTSSPNESPPPYPSSCLLPTIREEEEEEEKNTPSPTLDSVSANPAIRLSKSTPVTPSSPHLPSPDPLTRSQSR